MINRIASAIVTALMVVLFWLFIEVGAIRDIQAAHTGILIVLVYMSLRDQGRIQDLEKRLNEK